MARATCVPDPSDWGRGGQMSRMPLTVFSMAVTDDGPEAVSLFFLLTPFTVSEVQWEIQRPIE